jgi:hypothetical protein
MKLRTILISCALLLAIMLLVGAALISGFFLPIDIRSIPAEQVSWLISSTGASAPSLRVVKAEQDSTFTGSTSKWLMLSATSADVARIRENLWSHYMNPQKTGHRTVSNITGPACWSVAQQGSCPSWWRPQDLPDSDPVMIDPYPHIVAVFSQKTGTIYLFFGGY